jgi:hypothetical protein
MLEGMLRPAGFVLVIWSAAAVAGPNEPNANRPSGRVVRVARTSGASHASPRLCEIRGDGGTCVGDEPRRGETVVVLDDRHAIAEVQIVEAKLSATACPMVWVVKTRALHGATTDGDGIGVIDAELNPSRAHSIDKAHRPPAPSGQPGEDVWQAIDRDGDGIADILSTRYSCDASGKPVAGAPTYCLDIWTRQGPAGHAADGLPMTRTGQLNFALCNI